MERPSGCLRAYRTSHEIMLDRNALYAADIPSCRSNAVLPLSKNYGNGGFLASTQICSKCVALADFNSDGKMHNPRPVQRVAATTNCPLVTAPVSQGVGFASVDDAMKSVLSESHNSVSKPNARRRARPEGLRNGAEQAASIALPPGISDPPSQKAGWDFSSDSAGMSREVDPRDEAKVVTRDVEDGVFRRGVGVRIFGADLRNIFPGGFRGNFMPRFERFGCLWMLSRELPSVLKLITCNNDVPHNENPKQIAQVPRTGCAPRLGSCPGAAFRRVDFMVLVH
jgi:hypothetical protein